MVSSERSHPDPTEKKSTERIKVLAFIIIPGMIILAVGILFRVNPPEVLTWVTMTLELGIGVFIAIWIFTLQAKTDYSIDRTIKKVDRYHENVRRTSLERVDLYLSMAWNSIGIDIDRIESMEETQQLTFVENLLHRDYTKSAFRVLHYVVDQLQGEFPVARPYMNVELQESLRSIIERIQILYGLSADFPKVIGAVKIERWNGMANWTLSQIEKAQKLI